MVGDRDRRGCRRSASLRPAGCSVGQPTGSSRISCRWAGSGLLYGGLVGFGAYLFVQLAISNVALIWKILIAVTLGIPWVLISQLFAEMIFVGLVSYEAQFRCRPRMARPWRRLDRGDRRDLGAHDFHRHGGGSILIDPKYRPRYWRIVDIARPAAWPVSSPRWIGKSSQTSAKPDGKDQGFKGDRAKNRAGDCRSDFRRCTGGRHIGCARSIAARQFADRGSCQ